MQAETRCNLLNAFLLLSFLAVGICFNAGDYESAYSYIRYVVPLQPYNLAVIQLLNKICIK
jgi:hypothetical protein